MVGGTCFQFLLWNWLTALSYGNYLSISLAFYNNNNHSQHLLSSCSAKYHVKHFTYFMSFTPYNNPTKKVYVEIET